MTKERRPFSPHFKPDAASLILDQGYSHTDAARSLGLVESALRRWVNQLQQERNGVTPTSKALTPEQQKIRELGARINRLEREKSILKKAAALLMAEEHERSRRLISFVLKSRLICCARYLKSPVPAITRTAADANRRTLNGCFFTVS